MKHALERYNELVNFRLNPSSIIDGTFGEHDLEVWIERSNKEKENVRTYLRRKSLNIKKKKEFELLIQQYQAEIIQLLDLVFAEKRKAAGGPVEKLIDALLKDLEEILTHIEHRYTTYFNLDEKAPAGYVLVTQTDLRKRIGKLKKFCVGILNHEELVGTVFTPLIAFTRLDTGVSYRQLMFMKDLVLAMEDWSTGCQQDARSFVELLLYMNFNSGHVASFIMDKIADSVNSIPEQKEKLERLTDYLKQCNQAQVKPGVAFRPNAAPLKEQVSNWIDEEIFSLEKKLRYFSIGPGVRTESIPDEEKLHLSVSVEVLALFARGAKDSKLILNKQMTQMFRSIARFVRTANSESPSSQSLQKKCYGGDSSAQETAIKILYEMIRNIHKY